MTTDARRPCLRCSQDFMRICQALPAAMDACVQAMHRITAICALLIIASNVYAERLDNVGEFVSALGLDQNFYAISRRAAQRTMSYQTLLATVGEEQAAALLDTHLQAAVAARQVQWNANLLAAYRAHFTDTQLLSIANDGAQSPYTALFAEKTAAVSNDMQTMSADLLLQTLSEGLNSALAAATE